MPKQNLEYSISADIKKFNQSMRTLKTEFKNLKNKAGNIGQGFTKSQKKAQGMFKGVKHTAKDFFDSVFSGTKKGNGGLLGFIKNFAKVRITIYSAEYIFGVFRDTVVAGFKKMVDASSKFETAMTKIRTMLTGMEQLEFFNQYVATIKSASIQTGKSLDEITRGVYRMASAQIKGQEAFDLTRKSAIASTGAYADYESTVNTVIKIQKNMGDEIADSDKIFNVLQKTLQKANATGEEVHQWLNAVIPAGKNAGTSLEEVSAAFSHLTYRTKNTAEAANLLKSGLEQLPSDRVVKHFKRLGVEGFDLITRKITDLPTFIESLQDKLGDENLWLKVFGRKRAARAWQLLAEQTEKGVFQLNDLIKKGFSESALIGSYKEAYLQVKGTTEQMEKEVSSTWENMLVEMGDELQPFYKKLLSGAKDAIKFLGNLGQGIIDVFNGIKPAIDLVLLPLTPFIELVKASLGLVGDLLKNIGDAFKTTERKIQEAKKELQELNDTLLELNENKKIITALSNQLISFQQNGYESGEALGFVGEKLALIEQLAPEAAERIKLMIAVGNEEIDILNATSEALEDLRETQELALIESRDKILSSYGDFAGAISKQLGSVSLREIFSKGFKVSESDWEEIIGQFGLKDYVISDAREAAEFIKNYDKAYINIKEKLKDLNYTQKDTIAILGSLEKAFQKVSQIDFQELNQASDDILNKLKATGQSVVEIEQDVVRRLESLGVERQDLYDGNVINLNKISNLNKDLITQERYRNSWVEELNRKGVRHMDMTKAQKEYRKEIRKELEASLSVLTAIGKQQEDILSLEEEAIKNWEYYGVILEDNNIKLEDTKNQLEDIRNFIDEINLKMEEVDLSVEGVVIDIDRKYIGKQETGDEEREKISAYRSAISEVKNIEQEVNDKIEERKAILSDLEEGSEDYEKVEDQINDLLAKRNDIRKKALGYEKKINSELDRISKIEEKRRKKESDDLKKKEKMLEKLARLYDNIIDKLGEINEKWRDWLANERYQESLKDLSDEMRELVSISDKYAKAEASLRSEIAKTAEELYKENEGIRGYYNIEHETKVKEDAQLFGLYLSSEFASLPLEKLEDLYSRRYEAGANPYEEFFSGGNIEFARNIFDEKVWQILEKAIDLRRTAQDIQSFKDVALASHRRRQTEQELSNIRKKTETLTDEFSKMLEELVGKTTEASYKLANEMDKITKDYDKIRTENEKEKEEILTKLKALQFAERLKLEKEYELKRRKMLERRLKILDSIENADDTDIEDTRLASVNNFIATITESGFAKTYTDIFGQGADVKTKETTALIKDVNTFLDNYFKREGKPKTADEVLRIFTETYLGGFDFSSLEKLDDLINNFDKLPNELQKSIKQSLFNYLYTLNAQTGMTEGNTIREIIEAIKGEEKEDTDIYDNLGKKFNDILILWEEATKTAGEYLEEAKEYQTTLADYIEENKQKIEEEVKAKKRKDLEQLYDSEADIQQELAVYVENEKFTEDVDRLLKSGFLQTNDGKEYAAEILESSGAVVDEQKEKDEKELAEQQEKEGAEIRTKIFTKQLEQSRARSKEILQKTADDAKNIWDRWSSIKESREQDLERLKEEKYERLRIQDEAEQAEIDVLDEQLKKGEIKEEEYQSRLADINKKYNAQEVENQKQYNKDKEKLEQQYGRKSLAFWKELIGKLQTIGESFVGMLQSFSGDDLGASITSASNFGANLASFFDEKIGGYIGDIGTSVGGIISFIQDIFRDTSFEEEMSRRQYELDLENVKHMRQQLETQMKIRDLTEKQNQILERVYNVYEAGQTLQIEEYMNPEQQLEYFQNALEEIFATMPSGLAELDWQGMDNEALVDELQRLIESEQEIASKVADKEETVKSYDAEIADVQAKIDYYQRNLDNMTWWQRFTSSNDDNMREWLKDLRRKLLLLQQAQAREQSLLNELEKGELTEEARIEKLKEIIELKGRILDLEEETNEAMDNGRRLSEEMIALLKRYQEEKIRANRELQDSGAVENTTAVNLSDISRAIISQMTSEGYPAEEIEEQIKSLNAYYSKMFNQNVQGFSQGGYVTDDWGIVHKNEMVINKAQVDKYAQAFGGVSGFERFAKGESDLPIVKEPINSEGNRVNFVINGLNINVAKGNSKEIATNLTNEIYRRFREMGHKNIFQ